MYNEVDSKGTSENTELSWLVANILPVVGRLADQVSGSPGDDCLLPLGSSAVAGELLGRPGVGQPGVLKLTVPQHSQTAAAPAEAKNIVICCTQRK